MHRNPTGLLDYIRDSEFVLMDGAMGTELERRKVPIEGAGWSAFAVRDHSDVVRQIHEDYLRAGAKLHIVNSFALARHVLEPVGLGDEFATLNRRAVALFSNAITSTGFDRNKQWVAGSLSTFAANSDRSLLPQGDALVANYRDQAQILFDSGVDLFALEMLFDIDVTHAMLQAVKEFKLPVIVGFTCDWAGVGDAKVITYHGTAGLEHPLENILPQIISSVESDNTIMSIMHSEADVTDAAIKVLRQHWQGPIAVYPNSGQFVNLQMQFDTVCGVDEFRRAANRWIDTGVQIVGGCCGIGPTHIVSLDSR
ncbi:MAG: S-methylmethionine-dependent homocysteine/selenocysteine methylase [Parasphingorhabdus sp.]|jgi:S-methylmethionine-dependent homocysteine/selenocysteine methylase